MRIESCNIYKSLEIANLIPLLESQFRIKPFFRFDIQIRVNADSSDILAQVFLIDGRVTVTLSEAGTDKTVICQLIVQSGTEHGAEWNFSSEYLCFCFTMVIVYTIVFGTYAGRYA